MIEHSAAASPPSSLIPRGALTSLWGPPVRGLRDVVPAASDRTRWGAVSPGLARAVLAAADRDRASEWPELLLSQWSAFARTGSRLAYESPQFARTARIRRTVLAAAIEPTAERVIAAADGLWLLCEQSSWCWPAHDDAFRRELETPDPDAPTVDLGAGEAAALAAWADVVLGPLLDEHVPGLRRRLAREARAKVLLPFASRRWRWEGEDGPVNNWAPWIHGNVLVAAEAFADPALRAEIGERAVDGIDRFLAQLPADGAVDEGFGYWWQGSARAFDALWLIDLLRDGAVARAADGGSLSGLAELVRFPERMHLGGDWYASFSDSRALVDGALPWYALFRAARLCGRGETARFAAARRDEEGFPFAADEMNASIGTQVGALLDADWARAEPGADPLPARVDLPSLGLGIARERDGDARGLAVVVKAGHNDESHNHNDLGSVEIAVDGEPLVIDLGRATYTAQTFSDERYALWFVRSDWHSAPLPRGLLQDEGAEARAALEATEDGWRIGLDDAYPFAPGEGWAREVRLDRDAREVRIRDAWRLAEGEGAATFVCVGEAREQDGRVVVTCPRTGARLELLHDAARVRIETREVDDAELAHPWGDLVSRVVLDAAPGAAEMTTRARLARGAGA
ncbi:heparinase II/III domain-containing protein [Microbacterium sp. gxy059]|uniref:heparinase II/III domain-containing protein n=1 Tax=Microbacterium sp. gxy059 TaxID=2957199 RepID=UPI003D959F1D